MYRSRGGRWVNRSPYWRRRHHPNGAHCPTTLEREASAVKDLWRGWALSDPLRLWRVLHLMHATLALVANQVMTDRRAIQALLVFDVRLNTARAVRHWIRYEYSLDFHHSWPLMPRRAWGFRLDRQAAQAVTGAVDVRAKAGEARFDDGQGFSWVLFSSAWVQRRGTSSVCLGPPMAPEPISAPTLSAPRPIAPRHDGRAAARYRHSLDDQSSVWCLEAGLRGFTQGAQAGGRLVLRRALPENDAAAKHQALLKGS